MSNCNFLNHWDVITHLTHALTLLWLNRRNFVRLHVWMSKYALPFDNKVIIYLYPVINYRLANQSHLLKAVPVGEAYNVGMAK